MIAACWLFFVGGAARAQQAQPNTLTGFNGQNVSAVDIAAGPDVNLDDMRRLIAQKAGEQFSADVVSASVTALRQTGLFTEVQLDIEPDASGLRVTFILQPADYIGVLQFPGAGTRFPYTALMQATNIAEQTPYISGMEVQATKGVVDYLHAHGFMAAQVTPEIQRDEARHIVNILFHCTLKQQAKIRNIEFAGLTPQESDGVRAALRGLWARLKRVSLKPGQKYSEPRVAKAIPFIRDHLRKKEQLAPAIRLDAPGYDEDSNRVDVKFIVTPGPKVAIKVNGAKISQGNLQKLVPIYEENAVDQELVDEGEANLRGFLQQKGYYDVTTSSRIERQDNTVNVYYDVDLGAKHHLRGVYFDGDHYFSDRDLKAHVYVKKGFLFFMHGAYSQQLLNKSVTSLTQFYRDAGFQSVSIAPKVEDFEPEIDITFEIKEGNQNHLASLQVTGNATQPLATLERKHPLPMQPGDVYSQKMLDADPSQLLAAYLDLGYLNASVRSTVTPMENDPNKMQALFAVEEGPQAKISDVVLLGQQHTKAQYIQRITSGLVKPEQPQSEGNFLQAESNLYDLGIFDWASVRSRRPIVDQTEETVLIKVHESPLNSMDIGGGLEIIPRSGSIPVNSVAVPGLPPVSIGNKFKVSQKSYVGPRFTFDFVRHNLRGHAETATFGLIASRLDQRGFFTYSNPHFRASSWSSLISLSGERTTENPIYTADLGQASLQFDKALNAKHTAHFIPRYSFQRTSLYNILIPGLVLPNDRHVRLSTFDGEYIRDTRDKPLDAHHGVYQTADFGITSTRLGATADFMRFLGQMSFYTPVKPWLLWANNFRFGLAVPYSNSSVPLSERFFSGGADSLRGFPINAAGPQRSLPVCANPAVTSTCSLISVPVGGNMLFIVNSEARFPLPVKQGLGGVFFYDGGNVYSHIRLSDLANNFTHSVGFGLRYNTPVGPVRFDFGYRITSVPGVKATQYFVTLGQSF